jgi:hypothetical protein
MNKPYTLSDLIDDLNAIREKHGDNTPVLDGQSRPFYARHLEVVPVDDWANSTETDDGEIPGVAYAVCLGR